MPRVVRNFWMRATVDGHARSVEAGPRAKDGGLTIQVFMRDNGQVEHACTLRGWCGSDGRLYLDIEPSDDGLPMVVLDESGAGQPAEPIEPRASVVRVEARR